MNLLIAAVTWEAAIHGLFIVLIVAICAGILWWLGRYFGGKLGAPSVALTVWDCLFVLIGAIVVINFLLSLIGKQFIP